MNSREKIKNSICNVCLANDWYCTGQCVSLDVLDKLDTDTFNKLINKYTIYGDIDIDKLAQYLYRKAKQDAKQVQMRCKGHKCP